MRCSQDIKIHSILLITAIVRITIIIVYSIYITFIIWNGKMKFYEINWSRLESPVDMNFLLSNWMKFSYYNGNSHPVRFNRWNKIKKIFGITPGRKKISFLLKMKREQKWWCCKMLQEVLSENKLFKLIFKFYSLDQIILTRATRVSIMQSFGSHY